MRNIQLLFICALFAAPAPPLGAQFSTITSFAPPVIDSLPPLRTESPAVLARTNSHYFAFFGGISNGSLYQRAAPDGTAWEPVNFQFPDERPLALADAGDAALLQTFRAWYDTSKFKYMYTYRIYRTEQGAGAFEQVLEFSFDVLSNYDYGGQFNVIDNFLVFFSLGESLSANRFLNYVSTDHGHTWKKVNNRLPMADVRQAGSLFVLKKNDSWINPNDTLYWSPSPFFTPHSTTALPDTFQNSINLLWHHDTLYYFTYYPYFYFSASGGLFWETRPLGGGIQQVNSVVRQNGRFYLATNGGLFESTSPATGDLKRLSDAQDCYSPFAGVLVAPDDGLPWAASAATGLLRPLDASGTLWEPFDEGLPGYGASYFKTLQDTLFATVGYKASYRNMGGKNWRPMNDEGLRGIDGLNVTALTEHKGQVFAPAVLGYNGFDPNALFVRSPGGEWAKLDSFPQEEENFALKSGNGRLYRYNNRRAFYSVDAGKTWDSIAVPATYFYSFEVVGDDVIFLLEYNPVRFWRSLNGGQSWEQLSLPPASSYPGLLWHGGRLLLLQPKLFIRASDDLGKTWSTVNLGVPGGNYNVYYQALGDLLVASLSVQQNSQAFYRGVMLSADGGAHWLKLLTPVTIYENEFYALERYGGYFYFGNYWAGNFRFREAPVLDKLKEITPPVATEEPVSGPEITLSPNPTTGEVLLRAGPDVRLPLPWRCFDAGGRLVRAGVLREQAAQLHFGDLAGGLYWLVFSQGTARKMVVLK